MHPTLACSNAFWIPTSFVLTVYPVSWAMTRKHIFNVMQCDIYAYVHVCYACMRSHCRAGPHQVCGTSHQRTASCRAACTAARPHPAHWVSAWRQWGCSIAQHTIHHAVVVVVAAAAAAAAV